MKIRKRTLRLPYLNKTLPGYLRPPAAVSIVDTQNLLADNDVVDETQEVVGNDLRAAAVALFDQVQPHLNFGHGQGDITMFVLDMPDVPPPYAPVIIAQASQAQQDDARMDRTVGVCQVVENPAFPPTPGGISAYNGMGNPAEWVKRYFKVQENRTVEGAAQIAVLQKPEHGTVELDSNGRYWYFPVKDYVGQDRATLLVEIGDVKVKLIYFLHVEKGPLDNEAEEGTCPTPYWRVSLNPDDPNAALLLIFTPERALMTLVPLLIGMASLVFALAGRIRAWIFRHAADPAVHSARADRLGLALLAPTAVYVGYFGAGAGVMLLAILSLGHDRDFRTANVLKNLLGGVTSLVAVLVFVVSGSVAWPQAIAMMAGAFAGGYAGARLGRVVPAAFLRVVVIVIGCIVTAVYAQRYWSLPSP